MVEKVVLNGDVTNHQLKVKVLGDTLDIVEQEAGTTVIDKVKTFNLFLTPILVVTILILLRMVFIKP